MFLDAKIVQGNNQNETKMMCVIKYGLCQYFRERLKIDLHSKAFCFKFDKATISQRKKNAMVLFSIVANPKTRLQWHIVDHYMLISALHLEKGVSSLEFNADQFTLDIYFLFKLSAEHKADYKSMVNITE